MLLHPARCGRFLLLLISLCASVHLAGAQTEKTSEPPLIAGHPARFDADGHLLPWVSWSTALEREMRFYRTSPSDHGYPRFVTETFLEADWSSVSERPDTIPATQNGMGIISYLEYSAWHEPHDRIYLKTARAMGDYLVRETLTPAESNYPRFTRSTGLRGEFPLGEDAGSQGDHPYEIEPDKGGIAGYALMLLFDATGKRSYLEQALQNARVLAIHQARGDARHSPWPFRVDYRDGTARGPVSANMTYILRLYDALQKHGYPEFAAPHEALWAWIERYQIPSATLDGALFAQFFEDHDSPANRTAWAPLNLARYLLERRADLDPQWQFHAWALIDFVRKNFTHLEFGVRVCHEQDEDHDAWNGVNSTYGAVLAMYARAVGSAELASQAREALNLTLYSIDDAGRPRDLFKRPRPGGWQEDAHTDVIHNYVDAMRAYPGWVNSR